MKIFTSMYPDPIAAKLGLRTDYLRFTSIFWIDGLARVSPATNRLDILAIISLHPGAGNLRRFIRACKSEFQTICVWEIWNEDLAAMLVRYKFHPASDIDNGETIHGYRWDKLTPLIL